MAGRSFHCFVPPECWAGPPGAIRTVAVDQPDGKHLHLQCRSLVIHECCGALDMITIDGAHFYGLPVKYTGFEVPDSMVISAV